MAASTTTTAEFSAAIDSMRQRIGTARSSPTMRARPLAARPAGRSAASFCPGAAKTTLLHLANAFGELCGGGVVFCLVVNCSHRRFKMLAVDVFLDGHACAFRLLARRFLDILPFLAHEVARAQRAFAEDLLILRRQAL